LELIDPLDELQGLRCTLVTRTAKEPAYAVQALGQSIDALAGGQLEDSGSRLACGLKLSC